MRSRAAIPLLAVVAALGLLLGLPYIPGSPLAAYSLSNVMGSDDDDDDADRPWEHADRNGRITAGQVIQPAPAANVGSQLLRPAKVTVDTPGFMAWALMDQQTGEINGSDNMTATSTTASMIKAWLAADFLRRADESGHKPTDSELHTISIMIRDSDNNAAIWTYDKVGRNDSIKRLISMCALTDSRYTDGLWSKTMLSPRDTVRMGACIKQGKAAGPDWTEWLLGEMRQVRGFGRFGIIEALPPDVAAKTSIKNGWIDRTDGNWHVNCLAIIGDDSILAVMMRYPVAKGPEYGGTVCKKVTEQLLVKQ